MLAPQPAGAQTVTLTGTVGDSVSGQPVAAALVYLLGGGRTETDQGGRFSLKAVNPAKDIVLLRRIGYVPRGIRLDPLTRNAAVDLGAITMTPIPFTLDTLAAQAEMVRRDSRLADFYRRRESGRGKYLTATEIWRRNPILTSDWLRGIGGILIRCTEGPCHPVTARPRGFLPIPRDRFCPLRIYVDGLPVDIALDEIPPAWIAGLEVYEGIANTPLVFGAKDCGVVAIWTGPLTR